jgi:tetratricopeptide (TPR) repeat protein
LFAHPAQLFDAALRAQQAGRAEEAAGLYRQVLAADPANAGALSNLGLLLAEHGAYEEAEAMLREATRVAPGYPGGFVNLALLLHERERFDEAAAACEAGLRLAPGHRTMENLLVSCHASAGRHEQAIAMLVRMVAAHPGYAKGHVLLGNLYTKAGRPDEAVAAFEKAAKAQKGAVSPLVSAGECLLIHGRAEDALKYLDRALKMRGWEARALALKTLALADLGRVEDERALADPAAFVHVLRLADFGYSADDAAALNRRLSAFASHEPSMKEDPAEYATAKGWHSTTNLAQSGDPAIEELKRFIDWGFHERRRRLAEIDPAHPFAKYAPKKYYMDMWAVRMQDSGKMLPHIHIDGWLSGAYYVDVPAVVSDPAANEAGWIKFGPPRADIRLRRSPLLRTVRPEPGLMATFPSYIWHDTVPLPADNAEQRLVLAYDLNPVA